MSNRSKRKRTHFTASQRWKQKQKFSDDLGKILYKKYDESLSEVFTNGFTASTGAEEVKR